MGRAFSISSGNLAEVVGADLIKLASASGEELFLGDIEEVVFDTRKLIQNQGILGVLFLALKGKRDGHDFIYDAYQQGVRRFLISENRPEFQHLVGSEFFLVEDVLRALQLLAVWHRSRLTCPVVGITGSNGKTIVKEWLNELLLGDFDIARSPRSFNSQLGVALSILDVPKSAQLAIIEAGISQVGEMQRLWEIIRPNLVVFTHLGDAHGAGFASKEEKVAEKLLLAKDADVLVFPGDETLVKAKVSDLKSRYPLMKTISWGYEVGNQFQILSKEFDAKLGKYSLKFKNRSVEHELTIPYGDTASISNAFSAFCTLVAFERWDQNHLERFAFLSKMENRLSFLKGSRGNFILNDSYSADIESLGVALDLLQQQSPIQNKAVILSDFDQSGLEMNNWMMEVDSLFRKYGIARVIGIGEEFAKQFAKMILGESPLMEGVDFKGFKTVDLLLESGELESFENTSLLVKGARRFQLERVVSRLKEKQHKTFLEIDLTALKHNFHYFKSLIPRSTKLMCMVKAFGYGSGSFEAAKLLESQGVDYLGVAYVDEGVQLREAGILVPIMVMNSESEQLDRMIKYHLEPVVYSERGMAEILGDLRVREVASKLRVHIELDTGMHRLGFGDGEWQTVLEEAKDKVEVVSVFSHLSASEDAAADENTELQIQQFQQQAMDMEALLGYSVWKHIGNTGGILRFASAHFDMVRLGIGLYGVDPRGIVNPQLQPVNRLVTRISQIRIVRAGEGVGYGFRDAVEVDRKIAVLMIGYADGLWRMDGRGKSGVMIQGKWAPFVGNICMDMAMVDVTEIDCIEGDEVEIFGKEIRVEALAARRNTIPYEVLTAVSQRVARVYIEN